MPPRSSRSRLGRRTTKSVAARTVTTQQPTPPAADGAITPAVPSDAPVYLVNCEKLRPRADCDIVRFVELIELALNNAQL